MRKYSGNRQQRIATQIHKDIVEILRHKIKDSRINWVTINEVVVNRDHSVANIYWTTINTEKRQDIANSLEEAKGFIRTELAKTSTTYTIPQLKFIYDESLERGSKILSLINELATTDKH